jgi:cell division protein ZapA
MARDAVEVVVGGKSYRLVASTDAPTLARLAKRVDAKLAEVDSRHPQALLLAALALAHEVETLTSENRRGNRRGRAMLLNMISRVDEALDHLDENGAPLPAPPATP